MPGNSTNTDGTSLSGQTTGTATPGQTTGTATPGMYTQDDLDAAISAAVDKAVASVSGRTGRRVSQAEARAVAAFRAEHGLDDSRLKTIGELDEREIELSKARLSVEQSIRERDDAIADRDKYRDMRHRSLTVGAIERAATASKAKSAAVPHIAEVLRGRLDIGDGDKVYVLDESGKRTSDSVSDMVSGFLKTNDFYLDSPVRSGGSGGRGGIVGASGGGGIDYDKPGAADLIYAAAISRDK